MKFNQWRALVIALGVVVVAGTAGIAHAQCGPMDVAFVIDTTGSMGGVLDNVKAELPDIIAQVQEASGGDFRLALLRFEDDVFVLNDMAAGNTEAVKTAIAGLSAGGGAGEPEASDEAVRTVVEGLSASDRPAGRQTGDFAGGFRPEATKVIILVTDARPAGFDDSFSETDRDNVEEIATKAASLGIHISAIFTPTGAESLRDEIVEIMQLWASLSAGFYLEANEDGSGTAEAMVEIIAACGGGAGAGAQSLILDPGVLLLTTGETGDVEVTNFAPGDIATLSYDSFGLPDDSIISFDRIDPEITGTDLQHMRITIGPETPPGTYIVYVNARHSDSTIVQTNNLVVAVDCKPPALLGTGQLTTQSVPRGSAATLSVSPVGSGPFRYQWFSGFTGMTGSPIEGATRSTFTTPAANDFGAYWVRVTNICGTFDSNTAFVIPQ